MMALPCFCTLDCNWGKVALIILPMTIRFMAQSTDSRRIQTVKFRDHTVEIHTVIINGIECLRLRDVQIKFPAVQVLSIDKIHQAFIHDEHGNDLEPLRIVACIGQVVEAEESLESFDNDFPSDLDEIKVTFKRTDINVQEIIRQITNAMTQMYELHEYTTPRYFFILPAKHSDMMLIDTVESWRHTHYKLYFLCECSRDPKEMHVAPHEGYSIKKARDFVVKYAPYLRITIQIAQVLLSVGGLVIPQLGNAAKFINNAVPSRFQDPQYYEDIQQQLEMVDNLLNKVDNQQYRAGASVVGRHQSRGTALQGAELREIQTYLERVDDKRSLGNLYRKVTADGHVRWVCLQHYDNISYNNEMSKYIKEFEAMGGKFNSNTNEASISQVNITSKNVEMMCKALGKGFNIVKLICRECSIDEDDLEKLLDIIINRSSIRCLNMGSIRVRNFFGITMYTCQEMIAEFNNQSLKVRFSNTYYDGNTLMFTRFLFQNKIHKNLDLSATDFLWHESDLRRCMEFNAVVTRLALEYTNNVSILNVIFYLKTNALQQLKLTHSLYESSTLSHFCEMLKKTKTLIELDLMDYTGFEDEDFINTLLEILKEHKSIKYLNIHITNVQPSNQKEVDLMKSLQNDELISHLCISSSVISSEFAEALLHAGAKRDTFTYLEFYNCQVEDDDKAKLQSLYENGSLHQLNFYEAPRWYVLLDETNGWVNIGKRSSSISTGNGSPNFVQLVTLLLREDLEQN
ncbi:unnamed protein product [Rotaria magnacalcarata]|uniref:Uncharacterized protein n=2 Tax=Rotaria magnacalcarata TaxID=392030 RepID=A0A816MAN7_9BILA|nr:unnamed protein product [Rotaria magnacalcarata]CAF3979985.1 unnamed protein product [Rotaria magnacalcarata]